MTRKTICTLCRHTDALGWPHDARCPGCGRHDEPRDDESRLHNDIDAPQCVVDALSPPRHKDHDVRACGPWCSDG